MSLEKLPVEVVNNILDFLESSVDQNALVSTSRTLHQLCNSQLYKINADTKRGSALLWAVQNERIETLQVVYDLGWDLNRRFEEKGPLHAGLKPPSIDLTSFEVSPVTTMKNYVFTVLHDASKNGFSQIASWLLNHGADVNARCEIEYIESPLRKDELQRDCRLCRSKEDSLSIRYTSLYDSVGHHHEDVAIILLSHGAIEEARPSQPSIFGCHSSAFLLAVQFGLSKVVSFLATQPGFEQKLSIMDHNGRGAMHYACYYGGPNGSTSMVSQLIALGAEKSLPDWTSKYTPIMHAMSMANYEAVLELLRCGTDSGPPVGGLDLLHLCCLPPFSPGWHDRMVNSASDPGVNKSRKSLVRELVRRGYRINARVTSYGVLTTSKWFLGDTPLHLTARNRTSLDLFKFLIFEGGNPKIRNIRGRRPLELCYAQEGTVGLHGSGTESYLLTILSVELGTRDRKGWRRVMKRGMASLSDNHKREDLLYKIIDAEIKSGQSDDSSGNLQKDYVKMVLLDGRE